MEMPRAARTAIALDGSEARSIAFGRQEDTDVMLALTPAERVAAEGLRAGLG
jgi:hypothetical protein